MVVATLINFRHGKKQLTTKCVEIGGQDQGHGVSEVVGK